MSLLTLCFILISVFLSVVAQILLKNGMSSTNVQTALSVDTITAGISIFTNISVVAGLFAYVSSAGIWLLVLSKVDVSKAYPFVGLGFIGTMMFAYWFLDEPLTINKLIGTTLVLAGVLLIAK
jgi:multidrug transporter EmrE-like cation transporter